MVGRFYQAIIMKNRGDAIRLNNPHRKIMIFTIDNTIDYIKRNMIPKLKKDLKLKGAFKVKRIRKDIALSNINNDVAMRC